MDALVHHDADIGDIENIDYTITSIPTQYLTFSSVNPFSISNYNLVKKVFYSKDKTKHRRCEDERSFDE